MGAEQITRDNLQVKMSSEDLSASNCNDGNVNTYCLTQDWDPNPTVTIEQVVKSNPMNLIFLPFDRVQVLNPIYCCQERIVGATLSIRNENGTVVWATQPFDVGAAKYSIDSPKWVRFPPPEDN